MKFSFIIVDNNELHCFVAHKLIVQAVPDAAILTFMAAGDALGYISNSPSPADGKKTIVFLDLVMPRMDGFQFIESFEKLPGDLQANYFIVALTSSMNKKDINRLHGYSTVRRILDKPITIESIYALIEE
jgi:CheY-like chemotaxis protein